MDVFRSIKEINRLLIEINRLLSKGIINIYSKNTVVKKWEIQNLHFLSKSLSPGQFWGAPTHADITEFQTFFCNLKIRGLGAKLCVASLLLLFWKELRRFKVRESMVFVYQKHNFIKKNGIEKHYISKALLHALLFLLLKSSKTFSVSLKWVIKYFGNTTRERLFQELLIF